jgi:hypothetical protein
MTLYHLGCSLQQLNLVSRQVASALCAVVISQHAKGGSEGRPAVRFPLRHSVPQTLNDTVPSAATRGRLNRPDFLGV